ncbi:MAG: HAMP domain-containing protein [Candidatus Omnitrophica bacterium]|nr:HAMP domain-containing protein [Candidatus Omnitrophota bacterium]
MAATSQRRVYLVDAKFQFKYVKMILVFVVIITALGTAAAYVMLWFGLRAGGLLTDDSFSIIQNGLAFGAFFQLAISIPLILLFGVILTHRIVGPLVRVERLLDEIGEGQFGRQLQVRRSDELTVLVEWINRMSKKLERLEKEGKIDVRLRKEEG